MYGRSNARAGARPAVAPNRSPVRGTTNSNSNTGPPAARSQPGARGTNNRNDDEYEQVSPTRTVGNRQQKPSNSGSGYGEYDHLYKNSPKSTSNAPVMPKFVICYVCGKKYGSQSIDIHEPQCLEKWHIDNAKMPPHLRRPPPRKPDNYPGGGNHIAMDETDDTEYEAKQVQLIPCENCGRKFAADRIQMHQRSCKTSQTAKPAMGKNGGSRPNERPTPQQRNRDQDEDDDYPPNATMRGGANNGMYPCSICHRSFASDRIAQHEVACAKANKQRRVFDSTKQRLEGTEAAMFYRKSRGGKGRNEPIRPQVPKSNWRQKHEDFIRSIRYAKEVAQYQKAGGRASDLPPPPPSSNPDYIQCPHCGRNYAPGVADRHIPKCVNIQNKPRPAPPPGMNRTGPPNRMGGGGGTPGRNPISKFNSSSGGFNNGNMNGPPPNRNNRSNR